MENKQRDIFEQEITHKEWLTKFLNDWTSKLIANTIDLEWSESIRITNPQYAEIDQAGQKIGIDVIIGNKKKTIKNILGFIKTIKYLLEAEKQGELKDFWKNAAFEKKADIIIPVKS